MANFFKPSESDPRGYDAGLNAQTVDVGESSDVALFGGGGSGEKLAVALNDPSIATVTETPSAVTDQRLFTVKGTAAGNAMLEGKDGQGNVSAFMQIKVTMPAPSIAPTISATPRNAGLAKTKVNVTLKTPPFPSRYVDSLTPDTKLQAALDKAARAWAGTSPGMTVAVVALNPDGTRPVAHIQGSVVHYSASLIKIAALYSAFELRKTLRQIADELSDGTTQSTLLKQAAAYLDPKIMAKVATIPGLAGVTKGHALPRYGFAFDVVAQSGVPGFLVDFSSKFLAHIGLMISISDNDSAGACVHGSGYGYLNGALASAGFFDTSASNGIWLAGDYKLPGSADKYPAFRIPCANDGTTAQGATSLQLVRMLTLLNDGKLVGGISSAEMLQLLTTSIANGEVYSTRPAYVTYTPVYAKIGRGPLQSGKLVLSEASIVQHTASGRQFAVGWQNLLEDDAFDPISRTLNDTFDEYLKP